MNGFEGHRTVRIYNLLAHHRVFERVPVHAALLPIVEGVIGEGCLISSLSSIAIDPGEVAQPIHADDQLIPLDKPHRPIICNSMWALTDFTEANGATRLVPKSHLRENPDFGGKYETIAAEMPRGSLLVWDGALWHGGGANRTDTRRTGIAMNYCAGFIRQQENQQLGIPREIAARFAPKLQELCRLRRLPRADRPHREAQPPGAARKGLRVPVDLGADLAIRRAERRDRRAAPSRPRRSARRTARPRPAVARRSARATPTEAAPSP